MDSRVHNGMSFTFSIFKSDSSSSCINLAHVFKLNTIDSSLSFPDGSIKFKHISSQELTTPSCNWWSCGGIFLTNNSDVSCKRHNFTSDINTIVLISSGLFCTEMIVFNCFSEGDNTCSCIIRFNLGPFSRH